MPQPARGEPKATSNRAAYNAQAEVRRDERPDGREGHREVRRDRASPGQRGRRIHSTAAFRPSASWSRVFLGGPHFAGIRIQAGSCGRGGGAVAAEEVQGERLGAFWGLFDGDNDP